jgi:hypothetical protein
MDIVEASKQDKLVMCGTQNWDHYFAEDSQEANIETLFDITLVEFESSDQYEEFIKSRPIIDFSMEHENPMVLIHGKN